MYVLVWKDCSANYHSISTTEVDQLLAIFIHLSYPVWAHHSSVVRIVSAYFRI